MAEAIEIERSQTVILMRHGVASHNYRGADLNSPSLFDPPLVPQGKGAALEAGERIRTWWYTNQPGKPIELVITSPLSRCLQTAVLAFLPGDQYDYQTPVACVEDVREAYGMHYCDRRRNKSMLEKHWPMVLFEEEMTETDTNWSSTQRESWDDIQRRVARFFSALVQLNEKNIIVISHGVWIETCFRMYRPEFLGDRRVYNCDAFACHCISRNGRFMRLQEVQQI